MHRTITDPHHNHVQYHTSWAHWAVYCVWVVDGQISEAETVSSRAAGVELPRKYANNQQSRSGNPPNQFD